MFAAAGQSSASTRLQVPGTQGLDASFLCVPRTARCVQGVPQDCPHWVLHLLSGHPHGGAPRPPEGQGTEGTDAHWPIPPAESTDRKLTTRPLPQGRLGQAPQRRSPWLATPRRAREAGEPQGGSHLAIHFPSFSAGFPSPQKSSKKRVSSIKVIFNKHECNSPIISPIILYFSVL